MIRELTVICLRYSLVEATIALASEQEGHCRVSVGAMTRRVGRRSIDQ